MMPLVRLTAVLVPFLPGGRRVRVDDERAAADGGDPVDELEDVGGVEVVEDAEAEHDVELAVLVSAQVTHVAEPKVDVEAERAGGESRLLEVRLAALDRDDLCAARRELERVHPLEAR